MRLTSAGASVRAQCEATVAGTVEAPGLVVANLAAAAIVLTAFVHICTQGSCEASAGTTQP